VDKGGAEKNVLPVRKRRKGGRGSTLRGERIRPRWRRWRGWRSSTTACGGRRVDFWQQEVARTAVKWRAAERRNRGTPEEEEKGDFPRTGL
jgi:hypothetical protein